MEPGPSCNKCNAVSFPSEAFSCGHLLCSKCLITLIYFNHFKEVSSLENLQIPCDCKQGSFDIPVLNIRQILASISTPTDEVAIVNYDNDRDTAVKINYIEQMGVKLKDTTQSNFDSTIEKFDVLIKLAQELQTIYRKKMMLAFVRADLIINLIKFAYSNFNENVVLQVFNANTLQDLNFSAINFEAEEEIENKLKEVEDMIKLLIEYCHIQPIPSFNVANWTQIVTSWTNILTISGHHNWVCSLVQLKDGRLASASGDKTIKIWEEEDKSYINSMTLAGHENCVSSIIQLKDDHVASASKDNTVKVWEVNSRDWKNVLTLLLIGELFSLIQLKDGRIAAGSFNKTIQIIEVKETSSSKDIISLTGHRNYVRTILQMEDGRLASGSGDRTIKIWEPSNKAFESSITISGHADYVRQLIQLKDRRLCSASGDSTIRIWIIKEKSFFHVFTFNEHDHDVLAIIQLKDCRIASGSDDLTIKIWDSNENGNGSTLTLIGHSKWVSSLLQLKDGRIVSGSGDGIIKIWK